MCVSGALGIRQAMRMLHIVICGMGRSTVILPIILEMVKFSKKKVPEQKMF